MTPFRTVLQAEDGSYAVALVEFDGLETEDQAVRLACHLAECEADETETYEFSVD
jgi:hypothetical protein